MNLLEIAVAARTGALPVRYGWTLDMRHFRGYLLYRGPGGRRILIPPTAVAYHPDLEPIDRVLRRQKYYVVPDPSPEEREEALERARVADWRRMEAIFIAAASSEGI